MNSIRFNLSTLWRSLRLFVAACVCVLMLVSNATPAYSFPNPFSSDQPAQSSSPTKGEDKLQGLEEKAQKTTNRAQDMLSGKEVTEESSQGINEVQGGTDSNQMDFQGETEQELIKDKLKKATGQK